VSPLNNIANSHEEIERSSVPYEPFSKQWKSLLLKKVEFALTALFK
jgi:hypothetical protein